MTRRIAASIALWLLLVASAFAQAQANIQIQTGTPNALQLLVGGTPVQLGSFPTSGLFTPFAQQGCIETKTTNYTVLVSDRGCLIQVVASSPVTITLSSVYSAGFPVQILNAGASTVTLSPVSGAINGNATFIFPAGGGGVVVFDGTNYEGLFGAAPSSSGVTSISGLTGILGLSPGLTTSGQNIAPNVSAMPYTTPGTGAVAQTVASKLAQLPISPLDFGASGSTQSTTGTIGASSANLTLAAAEDFVNGEGILVNHAGASFSASAPTGLSVTVEGSTGSSSYKYTISCSDASGGQGAAVTAVSISNGNSSLTHSNYNRLTWTGGAGCFTYQIYGNTSGSQVLLGMTANAFFNDYGQGGITAPFWAASTAPASASNDWLLTTIASGGGTTALVLSANATNAVSGATVLHEDSAAIQAAITAASPIGNTVNLGNHTYNITASIAIGNGTSSAGSTTQGVILTGANAPVNIGANWSIAPQGAELNWIGSSGAPVVAVNGPLSGWAVRNIYINCNNYNMTGLQITSAQFGYAENLLVNECHYDVFSSTFPLVSGANTDSLHNAFHNITLVNETYDFVYEIFFDGSSTGVSDTDYADVENVMFIAIGSADVIGLSLRTCDSNNFRNLHFAGNWAAAGTAILFDYQDSFEGNFPSSNIFFGVDPGSAGSSLIANNGSPGADAAVQIIYGLISTNGATCPSLTNLSCHSN